MSAQPNEELKPEVKLLPCPFCGEKGYLEKNEGDATGFGKFISCRSCVTDGPMCESMDEAIEAWNRRSQEAPQGEGCVGVYCFAHGLEEPEIKHCPGCGTKQGKREWKAGDAEGFAKLFFRSGYVTCALNSPKSTDKKWDEMWEIMKATYAGVIKKIIELESMSAKEGE